MEFIADLHIHSRYSRATARDLDFENLYIQAQIKGITVVGTGDFTHPAWWREIQEKLEPAEEGLFQLKPDIAKACDEMVSDACRRPVRFMLATEISNIYKKEERTRKNHNLVFMPDLASAEKFNRRLDDIGNIKSDGRPILGLDARDLLEIVLETAEGGFLIPAHIWTPWFSLLGSKSGFDSVEACFEDLSSHIFALETGLSSDPPMNWRVSNLDRYTLVSNSDAHSPSKLGREANFFNTQLSYVAIRQALETGDPNHFLGTLEFYPEEGKYHVDGHRKCGFRSDPTTTRNLKGLCPVCGKPLTLGVLYRVEELADRKAGEMPPESSPYRNMIPLEDVLSEVLQVGPKTKKVRRAYHQLIQSFGSEFDILCHVPGEALAKNSIPLLDEAIRRVRDGRIIFDPGYDGEFGQVRIFDPSERDRLLGQRCLFDIPRQDAPEEKKPAVPHCDGISEKQNATVAQQGTDERDEPQLFDAPRPAGFQLNEEQQQAVDYGRGPVLISAGPGSGKTRTITCRISHLIEKKGVLPDNILAVTFTHKAADEMRERLRATFASAFTPPLAATFHGFCWQLLTESYDGQPGAIVDEAGRRAILSDAVDLVECSGRPVSLGTDAFLELIVESKQLLLGPHDDLSAIADKSVCSQLAAVYAQYQQLLAFQELFDFEDLIFKTVQLLEDDRSLRDRIRKRFTHIFVDEFQDINDGQYRLLRALAPPKASVCVIGDPDQAIYGFRGSDVRFFKRFARDYTDVKIVRLVRNYRSTETILRSSFQVIQGHQIDLQLEGRPVGRVRSNIQGVKTIAVLETASPRAEAVSIGQTVESLVGGMGFHSMDFDKLENGEAEDKHSFKDFAVLCRTGEQVQRIADQLTVAGIPCQLVNRRVLRRPAVAKLLAAYRVITRQGTYADLDLLTGLHVAGISKETLRIFKQWAYGRQLTLPTALHSVNRLPIPNMSTARQQRLAQLVRLLERLAREGADMSAAEMVSHIVIQTTLASRVELQDLDRLVALAAPFGADQQAFASTLAIERDTDMYHPGVEKVSVLTLHAAKGLEFPVVFIAGCEDNLLPYRRPDRHSVDVEEERRLFYVGMTRAKERLFLTWSRNRTLYGRSSQQRISPFVADIESRLLAHECSKGKPRTPGQEQLTLF